MTSHTPTHNSQTMPPPLGDAGVGDSGEHAVSIAGEEQAAEQPVTFVQVSTQPLHSDSSPSSSSPPSSSAVVHPARAKQLAASSSTMLDDEQDQEEGATRERSESVGEPALTKQYHIYKTRWYGLFVIFILSLTNSTIWINFSPIASLSEDYFGVSSDAINGFSIIFLGCFGPGYVLALWGIERFGVRRCLLAGGALQCLGSWIRVMAIKDDHAANSGGYGLAMFGQSLAAICAPMLTMLPARYAIEMFPARQIALATTIGVVANPFGTAIGSFVPSIIVDENGGMRALLIGLAVFASAGAVLSIPFADAHEDLKPIAARVAAGDATATAELRPSPNHVQEAKIVAQIAQLIYDATPEAQAEREARNRLSWFARMRATYPLTDAVCALMTNPNFCFLMVGYTVGVGLANAFVTLIEQMIKPCGYDKDNAGNFGGLIIAFGMIGSFVSSYFLDRRRKAIESSPAVNPHDPLDHAHRVSTMYRNCLRFFLVAAIASVVFTLLSLRPNGAMLLGVSFAILGLCVMPLLPIMILLAADCSPSVPEDASTGMLQVGSNYGGIILISIFSALIQSGPSTYETVFTPSSLAMFFFLLVCVLIVGIGYNYRAVPTTITSAPAAILVATKEEDSAATKIESFAPEQFVALEVELTELPKHTA